MIKLALKHWIYEACIDQVLSNIARNFCKVSRDRFKLGEIYRIIIGNNPRCGKVYCYNFEISYIADNFIRVIPSFPTYHIRRYADGAQLDFTGDFITLYLDDDFYGGKYD